MKKLGFLTMMLLMLFGASVANAAVCNEKSSLQWKMNTETDMDHYTVWHDSVTVVEGATTLQSFDVPHDPSTAIPDPGTGDPTVVHQFPSLPEGARFFKVEAFDAVGNGSGHSNEVDCDVNMSPATPTLILKFG